jgi:hypothetical protein
MYKAARALYYPHSRLVTQSREYVDLNLLKTSLLLWDSVRIVVPSRGHDLLPRKLLRPYSPTEIKHIHEAFELVIDAHEPSAQEQEDSHAKVRELVEAGLPKWLTFDMERGSLPPGDTYQIYGTKLQERTWSLLRHEEVVRSKTVGAFEDYEMRGALGLCLMTILADACAGSRRQKITNIPDAHAAFTRVTAATLGGKPMSKAAPKDPAASVQLATATMPLIDARGAKLSKLVALRKQEGKDGLLPKLRANYRAELEKAAEGLESANEEDRRDAISDFHKGMQGDLNELKRTLRLSGSIPLIGAFGALVLAPFSAPVAPGAAAVAALAAIPKFRLDRMATLQKHPAAYLYLAHAPRFQMY